MSVPHIAIFLVAFLSGCSTQTSPLAIRPALLVSEPFSLNGRVAVEHLGKHHSAGMRWAHGVDTDEILLLAPLGQTVARIYRDKQVATLDRGGEHYLADDAETLMDQVMGWHLPLSVLHLWVLGIPDSTLTSRVERDDSGRIGVFYQAGWKVQYQRYADASPDSLPSRMQLDRDDLQIKLLLDSWGWNSR